MIGSRALCLLVDRAVHSLRFYDPATASVAIGAMGALRVHGLHAPELLRNLIPFLPFYTLTQLTVLLDGLSLLRVSHFMITAHVLQLFLSNLQKNRGKGRTDGRSDFGSLVWQSEVAAMAAMTRVLQQHHTQRTVRAFLAAADRALASGVDAATESVYADVAVKRLRSSCDANSRRAAVQVLYLLEVFVNAGIAVTAPQTPTWLRGVLRRVPLSCFTLRELLHVHMRLFPADKRCARVAGGGNSSSGAGRDSLFWMQSFHVCNLVMLSAEEVGTQAQRRKTLLSEAGDLTPSSRSSSSSHLSKAAKLARELSQKMRGAVLRCAVLCQLHQNGRGVDVHVAPAPTFHSAAEVRDDAFARNWFPFHTSHSFYSLTRELFRELSAQPCCWWLYMVNETAASPGAPFGLPEGASRRQDSVLNAAAVLQLLHGRYAASNPLHGGSAGGTGAGGVQRLPRRARTEAEPLDTSYNAEFVVAAVRLLCGLLPTDSEFGPALLNSTAIKQETWELLSLLLATMVATGEEAEEGTRCFFSWVREQLQQPVAKGRGADGGTVLWEQFCAVCHSAASLLLSRWCQHWMQDASVVCEPVFANRDDDASPFATESFLLVHWCVASGANSLRLYQQSKRNRKTDAPLSFIHVDDEALRCAWRGLMRRTAACLQNTRAQVGAGANHQARGDETDAGALVVTFFCMLGDSFLERQAPSLVDWMCESALLEMLCDSAEAMLRDRPLRRPQRGEGQTLSSASAWHAGTKRKLDTCCCTHSRLWWGFNEESNDFSADVTVALRRLLHCVFLSRQSPSVRTRMLNEDASAPLSLPRHRWLYRLLILFLRERLATLSDTSSSASKLSARYNASMEYNTTTQSCQAYVDALACQTVDGVTVSCNDSAFSLPCMSFSQLPSFVYEAPVHSTFLTRFAPPADAMMSNIESFSNWSGYAVLCGTLRDEDNGAEARRAAFASSVSSTVPALAVSRPWHRDDCVVDLTRTRPKYRAAWADNGVLCRTRNAMGGLGEGSGSTSRVGEEACDGGSESSGREKRLISDLAVHVAMITKAVDALLNTCADDFHLTRRLDTNQKDSSSNSSAAQQLQDVSATVIELLGQLHALFWELCNHILALCSPTQKLSEGGGRCSSLWAGDAENAVLRGIGTWRRARRQFLFHSPASEDGHCTVLSPERDTLFSLFGAARSSSLLLAASFLWCGLHAPQRLRFKHAIDSSKFMKADGAEVFDTVMNVWRLQTFSDVWCRHLPLRAHHVPVFVRLTACLRASLSAPLATNAPADAAEDALLRRALAELETAVREEWQENASSSSTAVCSFQFLADVMHCLGCAHVSAECPQMEPEEFAATAGWRSEDTLIDLSPVDVYVRRLLPLHFLIRRSSEFSYKPESWTTAQFVAVTWVHVLAMHGICAYHPRLRLEGYGETSSALSIGSNIRREASCSTLVRRARARLDGIEQQLLGKELNVRPMESFDVPDKHHCLLCLCLVRELSNALSALEAFLVASSQYCG